LARFWKNGLIREMTFRGHFLLNVVSEVSWVVLLLIFIGVIFNKTPEVRGWTHEQYLFLMGTHMLLTSLFETFFFGNCWRISHLVRTGNLDFVLLRPANPQFLLSFEQIDFSPLANVPVAVGICIYALMAQGTGVTVSQVGLFLVLIVAGVTVLYALLFMFAITSVWLIRQTGVDHLWFYAVSLARYPAEIYRQFAGGALWFTLVFIIPVLLVSNLPANVMVRTFEPIMVGYVVLSAAVMLALSSVVMRFALRWYRSASS
jgi:ABC-2 type transport system permease protein